MKNLPSYLFLTFAFLISTTQLCLAQSSYESSEKPQMQTGKATPNPAKGCCYIKQFEGKCDSKKNCVGPFQKEGYSCGDGSCSDVRYQGPSGSCNNPYGSPSSCDLNVTWSFHPNATCEKIASQQTFRCVEKGKILPLPAHGNVGINNVDIGATLR